YSQQGIVTVQTGKVIRQDLVSQVTASGEIKPKNYINVGAQYIGILTDILVKEGDRVKKGQLLAKQDLVQATADVNAQKAMLRTAQADLTASDAAVKSAEENLKTVQASLERAKSDLEKARLDFERGKRLLADQLIAKQDFDAKKATYDSALAGIAEAEARISQTAAQRDQAIAQRESSRRRVDQLQANLARFADVLQKYYSVSPLDGIVTNLPVRVGETVVPGIQNSPASLIMTIADMSLITAEVRVDETDIVNVKMDQQVDVTVDAIPNKIMKGHVIEIGNTALLRSTGLAASQSTTSSQEAKDFKVVIALDNPPDDIRPGLSCTGKITTATRSHALTIPIQALTIRTAADLEPKKGKSSASVQAADKAYTPPGKDKRKEEIQGVFVISGKKAAFRKVSTGITGASDIEVLDGLKENDEIITGSYKVLRTIRPEATVKVDNKAPKKDEDNK
ncbi:MAG TPA: efflux RND transporter periplasmic adaptor subunit, partial [Bryobacterales bacterium]|nr:efflux RND transporter periplasmic adaptor subunit [Bryobacterales bacterium]